MKKKFINDNPYPLQSFFYDYCRERMDAENAKTHPFLLKDTNKKVLCLDLLFNKCKLFCTIDAHAIGWMDSIFKLGQPTSILLKCYVTDNTSTFDDLTKVLGVAINDKQEVRSDKVKEIHLKNPYAEEEAVIRLKVWDVLDPHVSIKALMTSSQSFDLIFWVDSYKIISNCIDILE